MNSQMRKGKIGVVLAVAVLFTAAAQGLRAAVVDWTAVDNTALTYEDGTPAPSSTLIFIGEFLLDDAQVTANIANWLDADFRNANMRIFGSGVAATSAGNTPGLFQLQSDNDNPIFAGKPIGLLAVDVGAQQVGAYKSTLSSWVFPTDADTEGTTAIDIQQLITNDAQALFLIGAPGGGGGTTGDFGGFIFQSSVRMETIPEPTTAVLVGMSLLGVVAIRRRK